MFDVFVGDEMVEGATGAVASKPEEDDMKGDRGTGHDTARGQGDGWWCVEPVMEDKSS